MTATRFDSPYHAPVLVAEVLDVLGVKPGARVLDGTLGGGGHSLALLEAGATVTGLDRDPEAIATARARLAEFEGAGKFRAVESNFADFESIAALDGAAFDGILLDLGVSSHQFDDESRGFSFREGAVLDMRMESGRQTADGGRQVGRQTAGELLNDGEEEELQSIFRNFGDEPKAGRLAREVVRRRGNRPFETSDDFVGAIRAVLGPRSGPGDFARLFQAMRIAVNGELDALASALPAMRDRLAPAGVIAVIAYHSGEDRIVKHAFREWSLKCICPPKQIMCNCRNHSLGEVLTRKAVSAGPEETARNPRARSAHLRAWRKESSAGTA